MRSERPVSQVPGRVDLAIRARCLRRAVLLPSMDAMPQVPRGPYSNPDWHAYLPTLLASKVGRQRPEWLDIQSLPDDLAQRLSQVVPSLFYVESGAGHALFGTAVRLRAGLRSGLKPSCPKIPSTMPPGPSM